MDLRGESGVIRLAETDTKSRKPRVIVLTNRVRDALKDLPRSITGYVFPNPKTGKPWVDVKKAFRRACEAAKVEKVWLHDLRRSFITNARRRGVPESVVMKMSGHRTRAVFERYNVVNDEDLRTAVDRIEQGRAQELARAEADAKADEAATSGKVLERF